MFAAPDLAVEILSPSTRRRDETLKRQLYDRVGVVEYWLIDPDADLVSVSRRDGEQLRHASVLTALNDDELRPAVFPGLTLRLRELLER